MGFKPFPPLPVPQPFHYKIQYIYYSQAELSSLFIFMVSPHWSIWKCQKGPTAVCVCWVLIHIWCDSNHALPLMWYRVLHMYCIFRTFLSSQSMSNVKAACCLFRVYRSDTHQSLTPLFDMRTCERRGLRGGIVFHKFWLVLLKL